jgi:hypothetical protein
MNVRVSPLLGECEQGRGELLDQDWLAADMVKEAVHVQAKSVAMSLAEFPYLRERLFCFRARSVQMDKWARYSNAQAMELRAIHPGVSWEVGSEAVLRSTEVKIFFWICQGEATPVRAPAAEFLRF